MDLARILIGTILVVVGLTTTAVAVLRRPARERALPAFGVFALLYGVRLFASSSLFTQRVGLPLAAWTYLDHFITYLILVPAAMFADALPGSGCLGLMRHLWQVDLIYGATAVVLDSVRGTPGSMMWMNPVAVTANFTVMAVHIVAGVRTSRWTRGAAAARTGASLFAVLAGYETLFNRSVLGRGVSLEPFGMLALIGGLALQVAERVIDSERRLIALSQELQTAQKIQRSILPAEVPRLPGLTIAARHLPMAEVAGDFYDFVEPADGRVGLLVADVSGHGVPAAIIASMVKVAFAAQTGHAEDPARVLSGMNKVLCGKFGLAYVTAAYAFIDVVARKLTYALAGHPPILLKRSGGAVQALSERGLVPGFDPETRYSSDSLDLVSHDTILLYTDGLTEAAGRAGEFFGDRRLGEWLRGMPASDVSVFADQILSELRAWTGIPGSQLADDVTLLVAALR